MSRQEAPIPLTLAIIGGGLSGAARALLATNRARYVTGASLLVDGGMFANLQGAPI